MNNYSTTFTTSIHVDRMANHRHNMDAEYRSTLANVKEERTRENAVLISLTNDSHMLDGETKRALVGSHTFDNGKSVYDLLEDLNRGKKPSRQKTLDDLFECKTGRGTPMIHEQEMIVQVGNQDTVTDSFDLTGKRNDQINCYTAKEILINFYNDFVERYSDRVIIVQAVIHMDEMTPHLHLDYIPCGYEEDKKRGLKANFSQDFFAKSCVSDSRKRELKEQAKSDKEYNKLCYKEFHKEITEMVNNRCREQGVQIQNPNLPNALHKSIREYREQLKVAGMMNENSQLKEQIRQIERKAMEYDKFKQNFKCEPSQMREYWDKQKENLNQTKTQLQEKTKEIENLNKAFDKAFENFKEIGASLSYQGNYEMLEELTQSKFIEPEFKDALEIGFNNAQRFQGYER